MRDGVKVFGVNRRGMNDSHTMVLTDFFWGIPVSGIHEHLMTLGDEFEGEFLDMSLDTAVVHRDAFLTDHEYFHKIACIWSVIMGFFKPVAVTNSTLYHTAPRLSI